MIKYKNQKYGFLIAIIFALYSITVTAQDLQFSYDSNGNNNKSIASSNSLDCDCLDNRINIQINFDDFATETTWSLKDDNDITIISGGPYASDIIPNIDTTLCLIDGCYTFRLLDSFGDGICCGFGIGSYTITNVEDNFILGSGGEFTSADSVMFCLPNCPSTVDASITPPCHDSQDGMISIVNYPGPGTEQYLWSTTQTGSAISNLGSGTYAVTITQDNGCMLDTMFTLTDPPPYAVDVSQSITGSLMDIDLNISGSYPDYQVLWSNGQTGTSLNDVSVGEYSYNITDSNGCQYINTVAPCISEDLSITLDHTLDTLIKRDGAITSVAAIEANLEVRYLSTTSIKLLPGFYAPQSSSFVARIESCNTTQNITEDDTDDTTKRRITKIPSKQ